ncbi:MAG: ATP-binding protein [Gammaproteobacteria bacterium]|nr:ATP-binding protein [Gammaproteobacteria bacterium]
MGDTRLRDHLSVGDIVEISLSNRRLSEGTITIILDNDIFNAKGIVVQIDNGQIGNVKRIIESVNSTNTEYRIQQRESQTLEKKETFAYDIQLEKRNEILKKTVCNTIASLLNTDGGYLYIGVSDDGEIKGLERDYSLIAGGGNNDKLERQIRDSIAKYLSNYEIILSHLDITFPKINDLEICEIKISPSTKPIFLKTVSYSVKTNDSTQNRLFDDFYIRDGNGKKILCEHQVFLNYWNKRFNKPNSEKLT